jgi:hypothetical protein
MCQYLFREGDAKVVMGRVGIGDRCTASPMKTGEAAGKYCYGHAVTLGLIPKDQLDSAARKRHATHMAKMPNERNRNKKNRAFDRETDRAKTKKKDKEYLPDESSMVDLEVLEYLGVNQTYDATKDFAVHKELNEHPEVEEYAKKIVLARWMEAKDGNRLPEKIEDLATILGVSPYTLNNWRHSRFVVDLLAEDIRHRAKKMEQFVVYHLGIAIKQGDLKAIELYQKYYAQKPSEEGHRKAPSLSKDLREEAEKSLLDLRNGEMVDKSVREQGLVLKDSLTSAMISNKKEELTN